MKIFLLILAGYVLAAPLTSLISVDLRQTEWLNVLTYVWIAGSGFVWVGIFAICAALADVIWG